jgi:hypothetical protein
MELGVEDREREGAEGAVDGRHPLAELIPMKWALAQNA